MLFSNETRFYLQPVKWLGVIASLSVLLFGWQAVSPAAEISIGKDPFSNEKGSQDKKTSPEINGKRLLEVEGLLSYAADDTGKETLEQAQARLSRRQSMILNDPDLGVYLMEIARQRIGARVNSIGQIFEAMSLRNDINASVISGYVDKAKVMMTETVVDRHGNPMFEASFLVGLTSLLKEPSLQSEDLLIQMLQTQEYVNIKLAAAEALAKIGTERALQVVSDADQWLRKRSEDGIWNQDLADFNLKRMAHALEVLRQRLSAMKAGAGAHN